MKLRNKYGFAVLISLLWLFNASAQKSDPATVSIPKAPADVKIDGKLDEWADSSFIYNEESRLKYAISSDDTYLYLTVDINQKALKQKVLGAGITMSFNTEGKRKKSFSFSYPIPVTDESLNYVAQQHARQINAKTDGFKGVSDAITLPDDHGFKGAYAFKDEGGMGYEIAIPLNMLNVKPGTSLNINIAVNALDKPSGPAEGATEMATTRATTARGGANRAMVHTTAPAGSNRPKDEGPIDLYNTTAFWLAYTLPTR